MTDASTQGKIKGYVKFEDVLEYIRNTYDTTATIETYNRIINTPLSEYNGNGYTINEHSENNTHWYNDCGSICFDYNGEKRNLFYSYGNLRLVEEYNDADEAEKEAFSCETTYISLDCCGSSIEIIKDILAYFGGGWIDENDNDNKPFHFIEPSRFTADEIRSLPFGTMIKVRWMDDYSEYKGVVFGENIGYEDGKTDTLSEISKHCANGICNVFRIAK